MKDKFKKITPVTLILIISLLLNTILVFESKYYKSFIRDEIGTSLRSIEGDFIDAKEMLEQIISSKKIDEWQHRQIYYDYDNFEKEYKNLYGYYITFESTHKDFTEIHLLFDMNDYLSVFGKVKQFSAYKGRKDNLIKIDLTDSEVENFKSFYRKNNEYISVFNRFKNWRGSTRPDIWVKIMDGIYEKGISKSYML